MTQNDNAMEVKVKKTFEFLQKFIYFMGFSKLLYSHIVR